MVAAASAMWAKSFCSESTDDMSIRALMWLCKKKFIGVGFGYLGGQVIGLPRSISNHWKWP
jgi:hypothetical protein